MTLSLPPGNPQYNKEEKEQIVLTEGYMEEIAHDEDPKEYFEFV